MRERYSSRGNGRIWDRVNACFLMQSGGSREAAVMNELDQNNREKYGVPGFMGKTFQAEEVREETWEEKMARIDRNMS